MLYYIRNSQEEISMNTTAFPVIDLPATGENISRLRSERGLTVHDLQEFFGFEAPQAIYKWQRGQTLPTVDNLFALAALLNVPIDDILIPNHQINKQQAEACCSVLFNRQFRIRQKLSGFFNQFFCFYGLASSTSLL